MYNWRVNAVHNALQQRGKSEGPLEISDLTALGHLDQYHYLGTEACDHVIELLGLDDQSTVLDIGSGIGGPARYIAGKTGCSVTGVELQADLCRASEELTARVRGLEGRVHFRAGDFVADPLHELELPRRQYDHFLSLLVFLHIPDREALLERCYQTLAPGGTFVIEDFIEKAPFSHTDCAALRDVVHAPTVSSAARYVADLQAAGFVDLEVVDLSGEWTAWTQLRHRLYLASEESTVALHGEKLFEERVSFYRVVDGLFERGNLGGARITGRKPTLHEARLASGRRTLRSLQHAAAAARTNDAAAVQVIEGCGNTHDRSEPPAAPADRNGVHRPHGAPLLDGVAARRAQPVEGSAQPPFPASAAAPFHDSLQYHFFFDGFFLATRVFHTGSLQHHSAWICDLEAYHAASAHAHGGGAFGAGGVAAPPSAVELHNSAEPLASAGSGLKLSGEEMEIEEGEGGASLTFRPSSDAPIALLRAAGVPEGRDGRPELRLHFAQQRVYTWLPASQEAAGNGVIHRPDLAAQVEWKGRTLHGYGYSKRYYGDYPHHWGYRFIHGVAGGGAAAEAPPVPLGAPSGGGSAAVLWTADATFGDHKYNYYKLLPDAASDAPLVEAPTRDTWQQGEAAYAIIDGVRHEVELRPLCGWATTITDSRAASDSRMDNRLCEMHLRRAGSKTLVGLAYNERCYGTVG